MGRLRKELTLQDLAGLGFQPAVCDFCGLHAPQFMYAASRTTTGLEVRCWRWCACPRCAEWIEAEQWHEIIACVAETLRRHRLSRVPPKQIRVAVDRVMGDFHRWSIKTE